MTREEEILNNMNGVAKDYLTTRNLVKNINKRFIDDFKVLSCEPDKGGAWKVAQVQDLTEMKFYKYKLLKSDNGVEFKLYNTKTNVMQVDILKILKDKGKLNPLGMDGLTISLEDLTFDEFTAVREVFRK